MGLYKKRIFCGIITTPDLVFPEKEANRRYIGIGKEIKWQGKRVAGYDRKLYLSKPSRRHKK